MKVNDPVLQGLTSGQVANTPGVDGTERQKRTGGASGGSDRVSLSSLSTKLQELRSDSPERAAYLERLANDIAEGRYEVDTRDVSRKIVSEALSSGSETETAG